MNWVVSSLLMFASSVALYLMVRRAALAKVPSQYNNLAMFLIPLFVFIGMGVITKQNFLLSPVQTLLIIGIAVVFSYIGNVFSLVSIERAPNPGYSLVISKSYVVFTAVVAIVLFNAELTVRKALAIVLIVAFSALIMLSQKAKKKSINSSWLPLSLGAFFCWGLLSLSSKFMFNQGVNIFVYLAYMFAVVNVCILLEMRRKKISFRPIRNNALTLCLIGIFASGFNLFQFVAIQSAPNIGYVNAMNASSISAVTVLAVVLFKDELSKRKLIGVLGVTAGLLLLLW